MIDFPASPTIGQQFTAAGVTWIWDGAKWLPSGLSPTVAPGINDNRLINGDMRIDQRNAGASGTAGGYTVDRWNLTPTQSGKGTWGRVLGNVATINPTGFLYYLGFQSSSAYTPLTSDTFFFTQVIEADTIGDCAFGQPNAQPLTLSFWAYSSLTGTFSGSLYNMAGTRSYPFIYSLPTANTWTKIALTIPGDTAGTWVLSGSAAWGGVRFDLGSGATYRGSANAWASANYVGVNGAVNVVATNGAQFLVTGVKLEIGSVATSYNRQSLAKSMADCQRYYQTRSTYSVGGVASNGIGISWFEPFMVTMRAVPTVVFNMAGGSGYTPGSPALFVGGIGATATGTSTAYAANVNWTASAEL